MSSSQDRQELLRNAVSFLSDPKTQTSPLAKRIEFLESKGLTSHEIEDALRQASGNATSTAPPLSTMSSQYSSYAPSTYPMAVQPPPVPQRDWRDYFIMAVVSGGVMFGVISLARKYLFPHLKPPSSTAYEADKEALSAQFDAAEALLREIQTETNAVRTTTEEQKEKVDRVVADVETAVKEIREGESRTKDEMREIRQEVDTIQEMLPKMLEKNKEAQLAELQQELKSLKALLLSRGPSIPGPSTPPPLPGLSARPSIPAWQLATSEPPTSAALTPARSDSKDQDSSTLLSGANGIDNGPSSMSSS